MDVERAASSVTITQDQIEAAPVRAVQGVVAQQAGVTLDPTGLYIRGGRANETGFVVDGVSAKDPLSGTGFGLDLGSNAFSDVEVTTGGVGADVGGATSGVISVRTQDGTDELRASFGHKRDDFGFNSNAASNFRTDLYELSVGGPVIRKKLRFFTAAQVELEDGFTRQTTNPDTLRSSIVDGTALLPRAANRWNGLAKLTYEFRPGMRLTGAIQQSLTVNQNTRMLQVTGNDATVAPGFQYAFVLQPDRANTFAQRSNLSYLRFSHNPSLRSFYDIQLSRLFTRLRADANGRDWRPENIDSELDPESILEYPGNVFTAGGAPPDPNGLFILPGPGFFNNGGIATRWHDHFAEELTLKATYTLFARDRAWRIDSGLEHKRNDYQWIDVVRPWVGARIVTAGGDTTSLEPARSRLRHLERPAAARRALHDRPDPLPRPHRQHRPPLRILGGRVVRRQARREPRRADPRRDPRVVPRRHRQNLRPPLEEPPAAEAARELPGAGQPGPLLQLRPLDAAAAPDVRLHRPRPVLPGPLASSPTSATPTWTPKSTSATRSASRARSRPTTC